MDISVPSFVVSVDTERKGRDTGYFDFEAERYQVSRFTGFDSPLRIELGLSLKEVRRWEESEPQFII